MISHNDISRTELRLRIRRKEITFGGNRKLKIVGTLSCKSGKRMKSKNRVFFSTYGEALTLGYRPCGHCMKVEYKNWKDGII